MEPFVLNPPFEPLQFNNQMKLCRFQARDQIRVGVILGDSTVLDLTAAGVSKMTPLLEAEDLLAELRYLASQKLASFALHDVRLLAPVEQQEVWAVGVTYLRSKKAR